MVCQHLQQAKSTHTLLHPRPIHSIDISMRLGNSHLGQNGIHAAQCCLCRFHRPLLCRRLHCRRLRASRYQQGKLRPFRCQLVFCLTWTLWHLQQRQPTSCQRQQDMRYAQGELGIGHYEHLILLLHIRPGCLPAQT